MAQPGTAAGIVAGIFAFLLVAFFGYKGYKWYTWRRRNQRAQAEMLEAQPMTQDGARAEPVSSPPPYYTPNAALPARPRVGSLYGEALNADSWKSYSRPTTPFATLDYEKRRRTQSNNSAMLTASPSSVSGFATPQDTISIPGSPRSDVGAEKDSLGTPGTRSRAISASSSTMAINRQFATSTPRPPSLYAASALRSSRDLARAQSPDPRSRRNSYLPHLPENRDSVQIVPPTPLGFGVGGLAQAIDQRTLGFSKNSGIGQFSDDFSRALIGTVQKGDQKAASAAVALGHMTQEEVDALQSATRSGTLPPGLAMSTSMTEQERTRYLAQGPKREAIQTQRAQADEQVQPNSQPDSLTPNTPDVQQSPRSQSPARQAWSHQGSDMSGSDIGPSVSQRGCPEPEEAPAVPEKATDEAMDREQPAPVATDHNESSPVAKTEDVMTSSADEPITISVPASAINES